MLEKLSTLNRYHKILTAIFLIIVFLFSIESMAQQKGKKRTLTLRAKVYENLEKAGKLIESKEYSKAKVLIDKVNAISKLNAFEKAQIANFIAFYHFEQKQYTQSLKEYLKVVKTPDGLPSGLYNQTLYTIAQLYFKKDDFSNALIYAKRWFDTAETPSANAYILVGQAHYMLKDYRSALPNINKGIDIYVQSNKKPKESWLLLLRAIYYDLNDYRNMLPVIKQLIHYYPKPQHLLTLASIYGELKDEKKMLAVLESLYENGNLKREPKRLENLASLYIYNKTPIKAARLLKKAMDLNEIEHSEKNLLMLSQAFALAQEHKKALEPLLIVAKKTNKAQHYLRVARLYMSQEEWKNAEKYYMQALNSYIPEQEIAKEGQVWLQLGLSRLEQNKHKAARQAFSKALPHQQSQKSAKQWLRYIDAEIKRIKALKINTVINS